ncbi:hypothetical protein AAH113_16900, partial [Parabacteroides distasonis]
MYTNRNIWNVSYPIFLSLLAQNVINVTDTAFLGRVGEVELGASAMGGLYYILNSATVSINRLSDSKLSLWCLGA